MGDKFDGIPLEDLRILTVDWEHRAEHIRTRTQRYGPSDFDVEPEWATEAATDPDRLVGPGGKRSIEVIGYSPSAPGRDGGYGRLLKVWLVPKTTAEAGDWWGASACEANERDRRDYDESKGG